MNRIHSCHYFRRTAVVLGDFAASVLVVLTGATAAFAYPDPPRPGPAAPMQPPPQLHTIVAEGTPGWQIALIAIGAAIFAAALAVTVDRILAARRRVSRADLVWELAEKVLQSRMADGTVNRVARTHRRARTSVSRLGVQRQDQTEWQIEWQTALARARPVHLSVCLCSCIGRSAHLPGAAELRSNTW